ncbi:hypothetical protein F5Y01DRAFT_323920 [Xylaria sp. FL0043]|nr:hypothetical protein F5Y01DRAFT_323920 [Xylaria sp. FL0043]
MPLVIDTIYMLQNCPFDQYVPSDTHKHALESSILAILFDGVLSQIARPCIFSASRYRILSGRKFSVKGPQLFYIGVSPRESNLGRIMAQPAFGSLPPELRVMIYGVLFKGATVEFNHTANGAPRPYEIEGELNILLTCRKCYNEGLEALWKNAIVYGHNNNATLLDLSKHLGEQERKWIRDIREVEGDRRRTRGATKLGLSKFPNLKTYQFFARVPCLVQRPHYTVCQASQQAWIKWVLSLQCPNSDPHELLKRWSIDVKELKAELVMDVPMLHRGIPPETAPQRLRLNLVTRECTLSYEPKVRQKNDLRSKETREYVRQYLAARASAVPNSPGSSVN